MNTRQITDIDGSYRVGTRETCAPSETGDLTEQHNVTTPLHDPVAEITERVYEEFEVLHVLDEPKSMADL